MYFHIERWTARSAWFDLSLRDRLDYLDRMGPELQRLTEAGVRLVGIVLKDAPMPGAGPHYVAVWAMPGGPSQAQRLQNVLTAFNWDRYFRPAADPAEAAVPQTLFDYAREGGGRTRPAGPRRN
jgi:hypothetical protein